MILLFSVSTLHGSTLTSGIHLEVLCGAIKKEKRKYYQGKIKFP